MLELLPRGLALNKVQVPYDPLKPAMHTLKNSDLIHKSLLSLSLTFGGIDLIIAPQNL